MKETSICVFCPKCASTSLRFDGVKLFECSDCDWTFYKNVSAAAMAILSCQNGILLLKRAKEPEKGKLDLPGGFIESGESAEDALKREIKEELKIDVTGLSYLGSAPNQYFFKGVKYSVCDLFFTSTINELPKVWDTEEIQAIVLKKPDEIFMEELAFPSLRKVLNDYLLLFKRM